jgi:DNA gyrase inhibitor GyrI
MDDFEVRTVKLEPMRVASVYAFSEKPEKEAYARLRVWAEARGLLESPGAHRIFGFNSPNPSSGNPKYGYVFWMTVGPETAPDHDVRIQGFAGGPYAVHRLEVKGNPYVTIPEAWSHLHHWCRENGCRPAYHQWLEEHIQSGEFPEGGMTLDLYCPVTELPKKPG